MVQREDSTGKVARYFDERAAEWEFMEHRTASPLQPAVALMAGAGPGAAVLDAGSGLGVMVPTYLDLGVRRVLGVDVSPEMAARAAERWADRPEVGFIAADIAHLQTDDRFDAVVIYNAYPHLMEREALVANCARLLRDGGRFVVAHSTSRQAINSHHDAVAAGVSLGLQPAVREAEAWEGLFAIDILVDTPGFYAFGGAKR